MSQIPNHGYNVPNKGDPNWHQPLNDNFQQYDTDTEIRDTDANLGNDQPTRGVTFPGTWTVHLGDHPGPSTPVRPGSDLRGCRGPGSTSGDHRGVASERPGARVSYPRVYSWACQWDSRVSRSPAGGSHVPDVLLGDVLGRRAGGESAGLGHRFPTPGLADRQPVPPTTSGPVGRISEFVTESHHASALSPTRKRGGLPRCYRCEPRRSGRRLGAPLGHVGALADTNHCIKKIRRLERNFEL